MSSCHAWYNALNCLHHPQDLDEPSVMCSLLFTLVLIFLESQDPKAIVETFGIISLQTIMTAQPAWLFDKWKANTENPLCKNCISGSLQNRSHRHTRWATWHGPVLRSVPNSERASCSRFLRRGIVHCWPTNRAHQHSKWGVCMSRVSFVQTTISVPTALFCGLEPLHKELVKDTFLQLSRTVFRFIWRCLANLKCSRM